MQTGIVVFFDKRKEFGYIRNPKTREEFYFRRKNLRMTRLPERGETLQFVVKKNKQGQYADEVREALVS